MNKPPFGTFRGWSIKDNKWVYGWRADNHQFWNLRLICIIPTTNYAYDHTTQERFVEVTDCIEVHPESLAMFVDFYDKDDKPIFGNILLPNGDASRGGDILSGEGYPYFDEGKQNYVTIPSWNGDATYHVVGDVKGISHGIPISEDLDELKIIGNAYENTELVEGEG